MFAARADYAFNSAAGTTGCTARRTDGAASVDCRYQQSRDRRMCSRRGQPDKGSNALDDRFHIHFLGKSDLYRDAGQGSGRGCSRSYIDLRQNSGRRRSRRKRLDLRCKWRDVECRDDRATRRAVLLRRPIIFRAARRHGHARCAARHRGRLRHDAAAERQPRENEQQCHAGYHRAHLGPWRHTSQARSPVRGLRARRTGGYI